MYSIFVFGPFSKPKHIRYLVRIYYRASTHLMSYHCIVNHWFRRGHAHGPGLVTWPRDIGYTMATEFKKGYPHGPAELKNLDNETIWSGDFWNGAVIRSSDSSDQETLGEDVRSWMMFDVSHNLSADSRVSCSHCHCLNTALCSSLPLVTTQI